MSGSAWFSRKGPVTRHVHFLSCMCIFVKVCGYDIETPALEVNNAVYILSLVCIIAQKLIRSAAPLEGRQFKQEF